MKIKDFKNHPLFVGDKVAIVNTNSQSKEVVHLATVEEIEDGEDDEMTIRLVLTKYDQNEMRSELVQRWLSWDKIEAMIKEGKLEKL